MHKVKTYNASHLPREVWDSFHGLRADQKPYDNPFFDPDFTRLIADVRQDVMVAVAEDEHGVLAYWPMHVGFGKRARAVGGPFSDRNGPVVRAGEQIDAAKFLHDSGIAGLRSSGMVVSNQVAIGEMDKQFTNITNLKNGWTPFLAIQNKQYPKFFKKMRRLKRKLEKEHSEVVFTFDNQSQDDYQHLIALKKEQYSRTNLHNVLGPLWANEMLDKLQNGYCPGITTILSTLHVDGKLAAAEFNIRSNDLLHGWLVGFDPEFSKYSPGHILTQNILEDMPQNGLVYYDAGPENEHYKKYLSNEKRPVAQGVIRSDKDTLNFIRLMGIGFGFLKENSPDRVSNTLARIQRRSEQIISTEVKIDQMAKGFVNAIFPSSFKANK